MTSSCDSKFPSILGILSKGFRESNFVKNFQKTQIHVIVLTVFSGRRFEKNEIICDVKP